MCYNTKRNIKNNIKVVVQKKLFREETDHMYLLLDVLFYESYYV